MIPTINIGQRVHTKQKYMNTLREGAIVVVEEEVYKDQEMQKRCVGVRLIETNVTRIQKRLIVTSSGHRFNITGYAREEGNVRWYNYKITSPTEMKELQNSNVSVIEIIRVNV